MLLGAGLRVLGWPWWIVPQTCWEGPCRNTCCVSAEAPVVGVPQHEQCLGTQLGLVRWVCPERGAVPRGSSSNLQVSSPSLGHHFTRWWPPLSLPGSAPSDGFLLSLLGCLVSAGGQSGVLQGLELVPRSISPAGAADALTGQKQLGLGIFSPPSLRACHA